MANADFYLKQGDTPFIRGVLSVGGAVLDLTPYDGVTFHMKLRGATSLKIGANGSVVDPVKGLVRYDFQPADTDTPGEYIAEWKVWKNGRSLSFPNDHQLIGLITPSVERDAK